MNEVRIWALEDASTVVELQSRGQVEAESLLEETLVANPDLLLPGLKLVGRQIPTAGGPLDLLGVDEDGRLCLFELKRGTLTREAVAQVIDYAADLEAREPADLADLLSRESGRHGIERIEDFDEWYGQQFGDQESTALRPLRIFLVGLGADDRAERMVDFLANNSGMDISLITFHSFEYGGRTLLARHVRVEGVADADTRPASRYVGVAERRVRLDSRVEEKGVTELFTSVRDMFGELWPTSRMRPTTRGLGIKLRRKSYARIDVWKGRVNIVFYRRAKAACREEFRQAVATIPHETWPPKLEPLGDADPEIIFPLTAEDWETHREALTRLAGAIYEPHQAGRAE